MKRINENFTFSQGVYGYGSQLDEQEIINDRNNLDQYELGMQILMCMLTEPWDGHDGNYIYNNQFQTFIPIDLSLIHI